MSSQVSADFTLIPGRGEQSMSPGPLVAGGRPGGWGRGQRTFLAMVGKRGLELGSHLLSGPWFRAPWEGVAGPVCPAVMVLSVSRAGLCVLPLDPLPGQPGGGYGCRTRGSSPSVPSAGFPWDSSAPCPAGPKSPECYTEHVCSRVCARRLCASFPGRGLLHGHCGRFSSDSSSVGAAL